MTTQLCPTRPPPRKLADGVYDLNWRRVKKPVPGVTDRNGPCPGCRKLGSGINQGRDNWMVCLNCKTKWCIGYNLVTTRPEEWEWLKDITQELENYCEVESVHDFEDNVQRDNRVYSLASSWITPEGFLGERPVNQSLYHLAIRVGPENVA